MRRIVLFVVIGLMALYGCRKAPPAEVKPEWTIMVYADGNNNLDISQNNTSYVIEDIQEMEEVGSTDKVKIIAAVSSIKRGGLLTISKSIPMSYRIRLARQYCRHLVPRICRIHRR